MESERTQLEGSVAAVVFQNPENGYSVLRLNAGGKEPVTVVGVVPSTSVGERLRVEGRWIEHSTYGRQLEIRTVERLMPENRIEILAYLSSHAIRGVGPKLAARIVERFGAESLNVIETDPARLAEVSGISAGQGRGDPRELPVPAGAAASGRISDAVRSARRAGRAVFRAYGELSMMAIQDNPYFLTGEGFRADFARVDAFALSQGMDGDDERRVDAGILYELDYNTRGGHVFVPREQLVQRLGDFLGWTAGRSSGRALERLAAQERVITDRDRRLEAVYLPELRPAERYLAARFWKWRAASPTCRSILRGRSPRSRPRRRSATPSCSGRPSAPPRRKSC